MQSSPGVLNPKADAVFAILIACLGLFGLVAYAQTIHAALANPVKSLRSE